MAAKLSRDDLFDVSDSTDWLPTPLKHLSDVESALRCQVCKDFFTTPMITSCSHTFCSLCIRRCLVNDGKCPACRAPEQELKLRGNAAVAAIVEAFQRARPVVLEFARNQLKSSHPSSPKRKLDEREAGNNSKEMPRKRTRSSNRILSRQSQSDEVVDVEEALDDDYRLDDNLIDCPICGSQMKMESINPHLDRCTGEPPKPPTTRTSFESPVPQNATKSPERLPQLSYSLFKEVALRKKLVELGISATGNRPLLERRHTEWVTLWNANCDSSRPRRKADLLHDLETWERTQGSRAPTHNSLSMGSEIRSKDFDGAGWSAKHDDTFQRLIESARLKVTTKRSNLFSEPEPLVLDGNNGGTTATAHANGNDSDTIAFETSEKSHPVLEESAVDSLMSEFQPRNIQKETTDASRNLLSPLPPPSPRKEVLCSDPHIYNLMDQA